MLGKRNEQNPKSTPTSPSVTELIKDNPTTYKAEVDGRHIYKINQSTYTRLLESATTDDLITLSRGSGNWAVHVLAANHLGQIVIEASDDDDDKAGAILINGPEPDLPTPTRHANGPAKMQRPATNPNVVWNAELGMYRNLTVRRGRRQRVGIYS